MNEVESDLSNLITILLDSYSEDESVQKSSENEIMEMLNHQTEFLSQLSNVILIPDIPLQVIQLSLILVSRMLEPHSKAELDDIKSCLNNDTDLTNSLKHMVNTVINHEDVAVRNFAAKSYALLFQILQDNWMDGLDLIMSKIPESAPFEAFFYLEIFYEITELKGDDYMIFNEEKFMPKFEAILNCCIDFIGTDPQNEDVNVDIRILSAKCIINVLKFPDENKALDLVDENIFKKIIDSLNSSFLIPDFPLFQNLLQIIESMITTEKGYYIIDDFLEQIFSYTMDLFEIPNPENCEATLFLWSEIAQFEFMKLVKSERIKEITQKSADPILQICKNIFEGASLPEILDLSSDTYSLVSTAQSTVTDFFKCDPATVFEIIFSQFQVFEGGTSLFTTFCFISSITVKTDLAPFSNDFLMLIHENWDFIISLEHQIISEPNLIQDENMTSTRSFALITIKRLIETLPYFADLLIKLTPPEHQTKKLEDIFNLINNNQSNQKYEHPCILSCYARIIGSICYQKNKYFSPRQREYVDNNYVCLCQYLWSLFDLIYTQFNYLLLEETTKGMNLLISNADNEKSLDFLGSFFEYSEDKLTKSFSLFESEEVRYSFQKSLCSFIGTLGKKMATDNEVCHRSFDALLLLIKDPDSLIYEEALKSIAMFIPNVNDLIDQSTIMDLVTNAMNSLNSESVQMIVSASFLWVNMLESIPDRVFEAIPDAFESLRCVLLDHPEFRDCHFYILKALSTLFKRIDPQYTIEFKDEYISLINTVKDVITTLNLRLIDDLNFADLFYTCLLDCYRSYIKAFITEKPPRNCPQEVINEERKNLQLLFDFASCINEIDDAYKSDELLLSYIKLLKAITIKTSRKNAKLLHKPIIKKPIMTAINRFPEGDDNYLKVIKLKHLMDLA